MTAFTQRTPLGDGQVADLTAPTVGAVDEPIVDDDAAGHPDTDGDQDEVAAAGRRAEPVFRGGQGADVVFHHHRKTSAFPDHGDQRNL